MRIEKQLDPLPRRQLPLGMLRLDPLLAAPLHGEGVLLPQLVELFLERHETLLAGWMARVFHTVLEFHTIPLRRMSTAGKCSGNQLGEMDDAQGRVRAG